AVIESIVVGNNATAITQTPKHFCREKADSRSVPESPSVLSLEAGSKCLSSVLHHEEAIPASNVHNAAHVARAAIELGRHNAHGSWGNSRIDRFRVDQIVRAKLHRNGNSSRCADCCRGRKHRVGTEDHLIPGTQSYRHPG